MPEYQVIARRFRPRCFKDVIGQEAIVTTLKNAIKFNRVAQAYLFCGSRGTGKTTLARIFAKALNCQNPSTDFEPCNQCASCHEIDNESSLDILQIDGASHRGIDDIRRITENVGYTAAAERYKIYIIDEVHMLTKEAFNALLKTLEEPPPKVKFFFATTEPHKVLPTILSRCQRFNLNRISLEKIVSKLQFIAQQVGIEADEEALFLIAKQAEGALRDAESLFDQILAFEQGKITAVSVNSILGLMPKDSFFELDQAGKEGNLAKAFEIAHQVFAQGKDPIHFVDGLIEHFRIILLTKLSRLDSSFVPLLAIDRECYEASALIYSQEQCLTLIEYLANASHQMRFASSTKIALETILLHVLRSHFQLSIDTLVQRLSELEQSIAEVNQGPATAPPVATAPKPVGAPCKPMIAAENPISIKPSSAAPTLSVSEDPTPSPADLGLKPEIKKAPEVTKILQPEEVLKKPMHHYDTLLQFAAIELEGKIQRTLQTPSNGIGILKT